VRWQVPGQAEKPAQELAEGGNTPSSASDRQFTLYSNSLLDMADQTS